MGSMGRIALGAEQDFPIGDGAKRKAPMAANEPPGLKARPL
jgi:hypothetical protein